MGTCGLLLVSEVNLPDTVCGEVSPSLGEREIPLTDLQVKRKQIFSDGEGVKDSAHFFMWQETITLLKHMRMLLVS